MRATDTPRLPLSRITRKGNFCATLTQTDQCGMVGTHIFDYDVECAARQLDRQGFVIDNHLIDEIFKKTWRDGQWYAPCEFLAAGALVALHDAMGGRAESITVTVRPNLISAISVTWQLGDALPVNVPRRLDTVADALADLDGAYAIIGPNHMRSVAGTAAA